MKTDRLFIIIVMLGAVIGLAFFIPPFLAAALIPAFAFGVILLGNPRALLFTYLAILSVYPVLRMISSSPMLQYLDEILSVALYAVFLGHIAFRRIKIPSSILTFKRIAILMFGYAVVVWLINRGSPRAALQCFFTYFSFIPFYILAVNYFKKSDFYTLLAGTIVFLFVNVILNIGWFLHINPIYNEHEYYSPVDMAKGTLAACNMVAYFCVMFFFLLVSLYLERDKKYTPTKLVILMGILLIQLYGTYTNHAYMLFALAMIPYLFMTGLWRKAKVIFFGGALAVILVFAFSTSEELQRVFNKEEMRQRQENFREGAKSQLFKGLLIDYREREPMRWMFGVGPGNGIGEIGKDNYTPLAQELLLPIYNDTLDYRKMQMTSISGTTTSAVLTLWSDFGLVGFMLFNCFYVWLFVHVVRYARNKALDANRRIIAEFLIGAVTMFVMTNILHDILANEYFAIWIWCWAALLSIPDQRGSKPADINSEDPMIVVEA